ncbi:MAG: DoxX family protein [Sandaracinaceae bacterium]
MQDKKKTVAYWVLTGLLAFALTYGGVMDLVHADALVEGMRSLGYPDYVMTILGVLKLAGVVAILAPRFGRLKEWAYAGIAFDLGGAVASHLFSGDAIGKVLPPLVLLGIAFASWWLRPASRKLSSAPRAEVHRLVTASARAA